MGCEITSAIMLCVMLAAHAHLEVNIMPALMYLACRAGCPR